MSRRIVRIDRTLLFKILSFSLSLVFILEISDVIVDHLPRKFIPQIHARRSIVYSPQLGIVTNKPYSKQVVSSPWSYNTVTYNKYGFRGPDWTFSKDNIETRIAILGDSYIEGREVVFDDLVSSVLEKRIGPGAQVMNFGMSGTSQAEQIPLYKNLVRRFRPDIVIHCVTLSNDFEDNVQELSQLQTKNFLDVRDDQLIEVPPPRWVTWICSAPWSNCTNFFSNLALFKLVQYQLSARTGWAWESLFSPVNACASEAPSLSHPLQAFTTPAYDHAKRVMAKALLSFRAMCENDGAHFLLMSTSGVWTLLARENPAFKRKSEYLARRYAWLEQFARDYRFSYLDLNEELLEQYRKNGLRSDDIHIPWDAHWTPLGHRLAAESIYRTLKSSRWIP
jgi:hypothetical protein